MERNPLTSVYMGQESRDLISVSPSVLRDKEETWKIEKELGQRYRLREQGGETVHSPQKGNGHYVT